MARFLLPFLLLLPTLLCSQRPYQPELFLKTIPPVDESTPAWAQEMYSANPNVRDVDSLFKAYYATHAFEKNTHTQNYKHWRRLLQQNHYVNADGSISLPTAEEEAQAQEAWLRARSDAQALRNGGPTWTSMGPFQMKDDAGPTVASWQANIYAFDQSLSHPDILFAGTETGGIFKSIDHGATWFSVGNSIIMNGVGVVKIHPSNPDIVFVGQGNTIYRSMDGGISWASVLSQNNLDPRDISINPANPQIMLLACGLGLRRSTDGGSTWASVYTEQCWDIEVNTANPNIVYLLKSKPADKMIKFFRSTDQGVSFQEYANGWYTGSPNNLDNSNAGARMAVTNADPNRIYVVLLGNDINYATDNNWLGVWKSMDGGDNWTLPAGDVGGPYNANHPCLSSFDPLFAWGGNYDQGFYNLSLAVSDNNPNAFLVGCLSLFKTADGGATYTQWGGYNGGPGWQHPDIQEIEINGNDTWVCSDGGINFYSPDWGTHEARNYGIDASEFWGFDSGWNEDVLTGGRYHNGNSAWHENYPEGEYLRLGGAEAPTGYVNKGKNREVYHSDISGKRLPLDFNSPTEGIAGWSEYPNEAYYNESLGESESDPRCYNVRYLGRDNVLWKTTDGGASFTAVYTFGVNASFDILGIEVSRTDPNVIFVVQKLSGYSRVWKTTNGGANWSFLPIPVAGASGNGLFLTIDPNNHDNIWMAYSNGGTNTTKVFRSTDGGQTWANLTSATLDLHYMEAISAQAGTDGGVYLCTDKGVFYRNNTHNDWQWYGAGLPARFASLTARPFYRDGKIRVATYNRGIWESPFYEPSSPSAQPMVDKLVSQCSRDTFYFEDYSILNHSGANWQWQFPGATYVSDATARNPRVVYAAPGSYDVSLTITDGNGMSSSKTIVNMVSVTHGCEPDSIPGNALNLSTGSDYGRVVDFDRTFSTCTFSAWIKPNGTQPDYTGIVFNGAGGSAAGLNLRPGNELAYHWPGGQWWYSSGLTVPSGQWSHVVLVLHPGGARLYLNGVERSHNFTPSPGEFFDLHLGRYKDWDSRNFNGQIEEVCIYNRALSRAEVRELMHLCKVPQNDPSLVAYYQFNENSGLFQDRVGNRHGTLADGATRAASTAPVGHGSSKRLNVLYPGTYRFGNTGLEIIFRNGVVPNGEVCATRLDLDPDQLPNASPHGTSYWAVHNFGTNNNVAPIIRMTFRNYGHIVGNDISWNYRLYKRAATGHGATWGNAITSADQMMTGPNGTISLHPTLPAITSFGQFVVMREGNQLNFPVFEPSEEQPTRLPDQNVRVPLPREVFSILPDDVVAYPNPVKAGSAFNIDTRFNGPLELRLYDASGKMVLLRPFTGSTAIDIAQYPAGVYLWEVFGDGKWIKGKAVFE